MLCSHGQQKYSIFLLSVPNFQDYHSAKSNCTSSFPSPCSPLKLWYRLLSFLFFVAQFQQYQLLMGEQELKTLIKNDKFRDELKNMKPFEVLDFCYRYPALIRKPDRRCQKHIKNIVIAQSVGFVLGILINVKAKSIYPAFLHMARGKRMLARTVLMLGPLWGVYQMYGKREREKLNVGISEMHMRMVRLGEKGNLQEYMGDV